MGASSCATWFANSCHIEIEAEFASQGAHEVESSQRFAVEQLTELFSGEEFTILINVVVCDSVFLVVSTGAFVVFVIFARCFVGG